MSARPDEKVAAEADAAAEAEAEAEAEAAAEEPLPSRNELLQRGDAVGLMDLAKAYRSGTRGMPQDLKECFACYQAAAELAHPPAQHALAVFYLNGRVVPRDERQAAATFRSAADAGFLPSKVFVANLYELGIHYAADAKKADVWYRSVARSASVEHDEKSLKYALAMADLGCVRYCLAFAESTEITAQERQKYRTKARAHGYREAGSEPPPPSTSVGMDQPTLGGKVRIGDMDIDLDAELAEPPDAASGPAPSVATPSVEKPSVEKPAEAKAKPRKKPGAIEWKLGDGLTAFFYALIFATIGVGGGFALTAGATEWLAQDKAVPVVGERVHLILPLMIATFLVLPNLLVYQLKAIGKALLVGAVAAVVGEVLWGSGRVLLPDHATQVTIFATGGFMLGLLVLGIMGGAKRGKAPMPKT